MSTVVLPLTVPLHELQAAIDARLPQTLTEMTQTKEIAAIMVQIAGVLRRAGRPQVTATEDGFQVSIPVQAACMVTPVGLQAMTKAIVGEAEVRFLLTPRLTADLDTEFGLRSEYIWLRPLATETLMDVSVQLQPLIDLQLAQQLVQLTAVLRQALYNTLRLRQRVEQFWEKYQQPQALPRDLGGLLPVAWAHALPPLYLLARPKSIRVSELQVPFSALHWTANLETELRVTTASTLLMTEGTLPHLRSEGEVQSGPSVLSFSLETEYHTLGAWLTQQLTQRVLSLPFAWLSRVRILHCELHATEHMGLLGATVRAQLLEPTAFERLGAAALRGTMTFDVTFRPTLSGQVIGVQDLQIGLRPGGLATKLLGRLLTEQVYAELMARLRFDLGPYLHSLHAKLKKCLPQQFSLPEPFADLLQLTIEGQIDQVTLRDVVVRPQTVALLLDVQAQAALTLEKYRPQPLQANGATPETEQ